MGEKDDGLGLSLSLKCLEPENINPPPPPHPLPLNLHSMFEQHNMPLPIAFQPSPGARSYLWGFDINRRPPSAAECEEEAGASSPNSTISSVSGKRSDKEEAERGWGSNDGGVDEDDGGETARKKLRLSKEQSAVLEETFKEHNTLNPKHKVALAKQLNLRPRQVEVWFQNRRARTKLKQTEVDCEYLKRSCENLTEENRRLQKEVNELRTLKLSPQSYMDMKPPTTLTMCPSCERVAVRPPRSSAPASTAPPATSANRVLSHLKPSGPPQQRSYAHNPGP